MAGETGLSVGSAAHAMTDNTNAKKPGKGTQSLRRALRILRLLGEYQETGLRAVDVIAISKLERSTVHRLLASLVEEQFVERDESKSYRLGINAMEVGFASLRHVPFINQIRPVMQRLARISGDTVFLIARHGNEAICLHREAGPFPVKAFTIDIGEKKLLGIGAGGLALLAALEDKRIEMLLTQHAAVFRASKLEPSTLWQSIRATRKLGYSEVVDTITEGVAGVGMVLPRQGTAHMAISIGAITSRLDAPRRAELGRLLLQAIPTGRKKGSEDHEPRNHESK